jgi:hypothetical protein
MDTSMTCVQCGKTVDVSVRFCSQCGHPFFIDLSRKDLVGDMFLEVLNSVYNLIITADIQERDTYFHPVSRRLINRRYELEYKLEVEAFKRDLFGFFTENKFSTRMEAIITRIKSRSSNAVTGFAVRATEELIFKSKTLPLSVKEIEKGINTFKSVYNDEYLVKDIAIHMSDIAEERRILFVFYIQDNNKHMKYFLDELTLQRWFGIILESNTKATLQRYRDALSNIDLQATPKEDEIAEEVINDMVFGYCVRLSESLFPIDE